MFRYFFWISMNWFQLNFDLRFLWTLNGKFDNRLTSWDSFTPMKQQVFYRTAQSLYYSLSSFYTTPPHLLPPVNSSIAMDENVVKQNQFWFDFQFLNLEQISIFFALLIEMWNKKWRKENCHWMSLVIWYLVQFHLIFPSTVRPIL